MIRETGKERGSWFQRKSLILLSVSLLILISLSSPSNAIDYPTKSIQLIAPFAPGGGADILGRFVAEKISPLLGQPAVVVNKVGGGGVIGTYTVLAAPPDGYTILVIQPPLVTAPFLTKGITFNLLKDFTTINLAVTSPTVIAVRKDAPWQTLEEFIADAKKNPGKFTYSTPGYGTTENFVGEVLKMNTGTNITQVPMEGTAPSVTAVLGGHVTVTFPHMGVATKYLKAGTLKALAVNDRRRLKDFPDIPTSIEKGFANLIYSAWGGFSVRSGTPKVIVEKMERVFKETLRDKELIEKLESTGFIVENLGLEEAAEFLAKDYQRKLEVAKANNMVAK